MANRKQLILADSLNEALSQYLEHTRGLIVERATEIASMQPASPSEEIASQGLEQPKVDIVHLARAIEEFAPCTGGLRSARASLLERMSNGLSSFTGVSAILAILFAVLGLCALLVPAAKDLKGQSQAFLDVAKIFAGAVVGSAGVTVASRSRRRA